MTYAELREIIAGYLQRTDATDLIPGFVERASYRISNELRSFSNLDEEDITVTDGVGTLPTYFNEAISVRDSNDYYLQPVKGEGFWKYAAATGGSKALVYLIDEQLRVAPTVSGTFTMQFFAGYPLFTTESQTVQVQDLYIHAATADGARYYHNFELADQHEARYLQSLTRRNKQYRQLQRPTRRIRSYNTSQGAL